LSELKRVGKFEKGGKVGARNRAIAKALRTFAWQIRNGQNQPEVAKCRNAETF
jgi:hypothetical protein